jgi:glycosyltransferase involved in cell wall biosynthesis
MRILELIDRFDIGGAESVVSNLAFELSGRGCKVDIVCLREAGAMPASAEEFRRSGIQITELRKEDGFSFNTARYLGRYIRENRIDLVHTHNPHVHHYGIIGARLGGCRAVVNTLHGTATLKMQWWAEKLFVLCCRTATKIVCVCDTARQACCDGLRLPSPKVQVIRNGIQLEPFLRIRRRRVDGRFVFGTAARLDAVKDQKSLLHAFAILNRQNPHCCLEVLGKGPLERDLQQRAAELGLEEAVRFRGFSRDVASFLANIDCFVLSSKSEGLPMAVLEAMAAGLPVVSTAVGAIPELIRQCDCGWLCPPGDSAQLASVMKLAADAGPDEIAVRGDRGRASVVENYSVVKMGDAYLSLFNSIAGRRISVVQDPTKLHDSRIRP